MGSLRCRDNVVGMPCAMRGVVCALGMLVGAIIGAGVMLTGSVAMAQSTPAADAPMERRVEESLRTRIARFTGDETTIAAGVLATGDMGMLAGVPVRMRWRLEIDGPAATPEKRAEEQLLDPTGAKRPVRVISRELVAGPQGVRLMESYPANVAVPPVTIGWTRAETWMLRDGAMERSEVGVADAGVEAGGAGGARPMYARRAAASAVGDVIRLLRPELGGVSSGAGAMQVRSVRVTGTRFEATLGLATSTAEADRTTIRGRIEPRTGAVVIDEATLAGGERLTLSEHVSLGEALAGAMAGAGGTGTGKGGVIRPELAGEMIARRVRIDVPAGDRGEALRATLWWEDGAVLDEALASASARAPEAMATIRQTVHPNMTNFVEGGRFWAEPMLPTIPTDNASPIGGGGGGGGGTQLLIGLAAATITLVVLVLMAGRK
jgi:hypothetical protein